MEKRKLLLVAISVGIFFVIAIGAAIVFTPHPQEVIVASRVAPFYPVPGVTAINVTPTAPGEGQQAAEQPVIQVAPVDPVGLVRAPVDGLGLQPPPGGAIRQGGDIVVTGPGETVINVPRPTTVAVPDTPPPPPQRVQPAPAPRPAAPAPRPAAPAPAPARPAPRPAQIDYWVQAGSFSTITNAERAKEALASSGIASIIETREVDGRSWFRVRIGPYTSQNEANYWLALIRSIDGFNSEYERYRPAVWQTARR